MKDDQEIGHVLTNKLEIDDKVILEHGINSERIGSLAEYIEPVSPEIQAAEVYKRFRADPDLMSIAVVDGKLPVGLINWHDLAMKLARDYGRALHALNPVATVMDRTPLIVESDINIDALEWLIASERPGALSQGFIVTHAGRYLGVGSALSLLRASLRRTERQKRRLERAGLKLARANKSKSRFLANTSHELRTPLNAITGFSDALRSGTFGAIENPRHASYIDDIHTSATHLLAIVGDILDMAKIEEGKMTLVEQNLDPAALIRWAVRFVEERATRNKVDLQIVIVGELPSLVADERALRQILLNLLSNAIKFTPAGGRAAVRAAMTETGDLDIAISDTGIGIPPDEIEHVLAPFEQVANEFSRSHDGTGLGLPLAKALADLHQARFRIESEVNKGTRVTVTFPAARLLPARSAKADPEDDDDAVSIAS